VNRLREEPSTTTGKSFQDDAFKKGATQKSAAIVRPTWSRFSPGHLTEEVGKGEESDAFNNVSDVTGQQANQTFRLHPKPNPKPKTADAAAQGPD